MKRTTLILSIALAFTMLLGISCKKDTPYMTNATITGVDYRSCVCCGGLIIVFDGDSNSNFKLIGNSSDLGISDTGPFPIYVRVDWQPDVSNACNHILITRFERR